MGNQPFWSFTMFDADFYEYRESWERDNPILKGELMCIAHNFDPLYGYRHLTRNATNYGSKNSWYTYMRTVKVEKQDVFNSWIIEVHPTAENTEKPFHKPHHIFKVMMPREFLDGDKFMELNIQSDDDQPKPNKSVLVGANITL